MTLNDFSEPTSISLEETVVRLAEEEVPVRVIARAVKIPMDQVQLLLEEARDAGRILRIPRPDWHPHKKGVLTDVSFAAMDSEEVVLNCIRMFTLTKLQASMFYPLIIRNEVSKNALHQVIETRRGATKKDETDPKMVDVVICHLRKKLKHFGIEIKTLWACGYYMEPDQRRRVQELVANYGSAENGQTKEGSTPSTPGAGKRTSS